MASQIDMSGRVAIITGGGKGVGRGITRRYHEAGADVVICGRKPLSGPVSDAGKTARFVQADVRDPEQIQTVIDAAVESHGRIDVLVNNAGGSAPVDTLTVSPRFNSSIVDLNLLAPLNFSVAAYKVMAEQDDGGVILFISSVAAAYPDPVTTAYAAAKAGLVNLSKALSLSFAPKVRCNTITSGLIITENSAEYYGEDGAALVDQIPLHRMGRPDDIGNACLLLSDPVLAGWITGANLECHGGLSIPLTVIEDE